jgi:hypothetical protein
LDFPKETRNERSKKLSDAKSGRAVEGVKYDRISVALVNAIKQLQKKIEELNSIKSENAELRAQLADVLAGSSASKRREAVESEGQIVTAYGKYRRVRCGSKAILRRTSRLNESVPL